MKASDPDERKLTDDQRAMLDYIFDETPKPFELADGTGKGPVCESRTVYWVQTVHGTPHMLRGEAVEHVRRDDRTRGWTVTLDAGDATKFNESDVPRTRFVLNLEKMGFCSHPQSALEYEAKMTQSVIGDHKQSIATLEEHQNRLRWLCRNKGLVPTCGLENEQ